MGKYHPFMGTSPKKLAYVVSRFPASAEIWIVRELDALAERGDCDPALWSLFPARDPVVHPAAERWLPRLRRPRAWHGAAAIAYWMVRRPSALLGAVARIIAGTWRHPGTLFRSLACVPFAAANACQIERSKVEHVHAHFASYPTLCAWLCKRLSGVTYSFTAHAYDIFVSQDLLSEKVAAAEFVVTISEFNRRFLRDFGGDRQTPVRIVHCGIDPSKYEFRPRVPRRDQPRALCVASLEEKKGHSILLAAVARDPRLARLSLDLVGDGPRRDELEREAASLGLAERVRVHGALSEERVRHMLGIADLFVLPSVVAPNGQAEGLPVSLIEALASGVPVVASRMSGIPELITDRATGILTPPGDVAQLSSALDWVLDGGELDLARGRALVEAEFDVRRSAAQMAELFGARPVGAIRTPSLPDVPVAA
jgi:colanic acid/amylovoran biosynthesis glycosyltransferase